MGRPAARRLPDGRLHLNHGPIDLIVFADGDRAAVETAFAAAAARFDTLLEELVEELPVLRRRLDETIEVHGETARRMVAACRPFATNHFITPMAAVAGAGAETILAAMTTAAPLDRAYVNNGGDIALHLAADTALDVGVVRDLVHAVPEGRMRIEAESPVRGIATSGWPGRSFSLGIADVVTVLACSASLADAAATVIANAVDADDPAVVRRPARTIDPDSDLGDHLVTVVVGPLDPATVTLALDRGTWFAGRLRREGLIEAALLSLQGEWRSVG